MFSVYSKVIPSLAFRLHQEDALDVFMEQVKETGWIARSRVLFGGGVPLRKAGQRVAGKEASTDVLEGTSVSRPTLQVRGLPAIFKFPGLTDISTDYAFHLIHPAVHSPNRVGSVVESFAGEADGVHDGSGIAYFRPRLHIWSADAAMKESKHPAFTAAKGRRPRSLEYILLRISSEKPSRRSLAGPMP
ncbi:uncharacterized protein THITE_115060 [Thermothielavioides terrestris NRRL 8126]|uniref:Uncharacterized protein n=1 Tax=Thermothielavioides terrestris (strain ATCC 38088 / NRRL 8126) TaxID=578455 RepID=G2REV0_THETT|nr:uncharacterized protein THITE_115060 [Thermothielavioides terrestris NRRL 8126]AEO70233.1 hypothetical protein THITE_115060 [Thermothielavioides terrestris NRRL 8126]